MRLSTKFEENRRGEGFFSVHLVWNEPFAVVVVRVANNVDFLTSSQRVIYPNKIYLIICFYLYLICNTL